MINLKNGLSVILPAYHEAENLKVMLPKLISALGASAGCYEIIVVDTSTPFDDTFEVCSRYAEQVRCIARQGGNSYGDAIRTGIVNCSYSHTAVMDSDGSHSPEDLLKIYQTFLEHNCDVCIGSRYVSAGKSFNNGFLKFLSHCVNWSFKLLFHIPVKDISNSFRIYQTQKLQSIELECLNFDLVEEILIKLYWRYPDLQVREVPINFARRLSGESKREFWTFSCSYFKTFGRLIALKRKLRR